MSVFSGIHGDCNQVTIAINAKDAASLFGISLRTWRRFDSNGRIPPGYMLGGRKVWRRSDLEEWAAWGFPMRDEFNTRLNGDDEHTVKNVV